MKVTLIVPWRPTPDRVPAWSWLSRRWASLFPKWEIIEADCPGVWNKSKAVNSAVERSKGDILFVADADCIVNERTIRQSVIAAKEAPWVVPHRRVHRLTKPVTQRLLSCSPIHPLPKEPGRTIRRPITGIAGGGLYVISRENFYAAGEMDEGFKGWGGEDSAFGIAVDTLVGPHVRFDTPLVHLWHNVGPRNSHPDWKENLERVYKYKDARDDKTAMKKLIDTRY